MGKRILGIDIGGTSTKIGLVTSEGNIASKWQIRTNKNNHGKTIVEDVWQSIIKQVTIQQINKCDILGIGVGVPGFIDGNTGMVNEAVNIGWKNFDLRKRLKNLSGLPVFLENDANLAALGENWKGAGGRSRNLFAITLGTGVGGGIIANGRILNGVNGTAGEIGHITVDPNGYLCNCGRIGCLETIASATGIVRQALNIAKENPKSDLALYYKKSKEDITAKDIFDLANKGDKMCEQIIIYTGDLLGLTIANIATVINPSKIIIGGGVSTAGNQFIDIIKTSFEKYALSRVSDICEIKGAQLGMNAGIVGAASLVKRKLGTM